MWILDFLFPPLCRCCQEECETLYLCPACWSLSELPDPVERCRICFNERDRDHSLCTQCGEKPPLPATRAYVFESNAPIGRLGFDFPEAYAAFAYYQWVQLEWPLPDAIVSMPDRDSRAIAKVFASLLELPLISYRDDLDQLELLLFDACNSLEIIRNETYKLVESFPKRIFILSLLNYDTPHFVMHDVSAPLPPLSGDQDRAATRDLGR
jgi:hypothetical protein